VGKLMEERVEAFLADEQVLSNPSSSSGTYRRREELVPHCTERCPRALQRNNGRWSDLCRKSY
jgi:hypothetical protein